MNHPQAYPKFLANSFVTTSDGGLAHVFLIPGSAATNLGDDGKHAVVVNADGTYPFGNLITYSFSATSPFTFYIRIPTWAGQNSTLNNKTTISPDPSSGLQKLNVPAGQSSASIQLSMTPRVESRANNTAAIYYGPLLYALAIDYDSQSSAPINYHTQQVLAANTTDPQGRTKDFRLTPQAGSKWNIAIDPRHIQVVGGNSSSRTNQLASPIWEPGAPPVELRVAAVEIDWPVELDSPADPGDFAVKPVGTPFMARFVPYGSAKLHMALLPVVQLDDPQGKNKSARNVDGRE